MKENIDRIGISWRPEVGVAILENLDSIRILEVVAENCFNLKNSELETFKRLSTQIPIMVHAVSLGLASQFPVQKSNLENVARVVNFIQPEAWSEHLAFVRTPEHELGHLAAPPWSEEVIESTVRNIHYATKAVGSTPHLENIATLYKPLGSTMSEGAWTTEIIRRSNCKLLIDLENIYANCRNFGLDLYEQLSTYPLESVSYVHIAGGHEAHDKDGSFYLDDHCHPVEELTFELLEELGARVSQPLSIILERDGKFPPTEELLAELSRAKIALSKGRARKKVACNE